MSDRPIRIPGPDHPITIAPSPHRIVVRIGETIVADTRAALSLQEASYPAVLYIPRADVAMAHLQRSDHVSYCPYKGEASYYDLPELGDRAAQAVWCYEAPYDAVAAIAGHLAFYPDRVAISELA